MSLNKKLRVLRMADSAIVYQAVANQFNVTPQAISEIIQFRQTLEKMKDYQTSM